MEIYRDDKVGHQGRSQRAGADAPQAAQTGGKCKQMRADNFTKSTLIVEYFSPLRAVPEHDVALDSENVKEKMDYGNDEGESE
jgi:hypothetical protein